MSEPEADNTVDQVRRFSEGLAALMLPLVQGAAELADAMEQRARAWIEDEARKVGMTPTELLRSWARTIERWKNPPAITLPAYTVPQAPSLPVSLDEEERATDEEQPATPRRKIGFTVEEDDGIDDK